MPTRLASVLVPIISILLALIFGGILLLIAGESPFAVYRAMLDG